MKEQNTGAGSSSSGEWWDHLEDFVRGHIQRFIQSLLEAEVTERLGRKKSERRTAVDAPEGYRNGYGKPRKLALTCGTITVRRPRVRSLAERFVSRLLPLFKRRTKQVGELLPRLYLHGLALGDFELALRGLLGDGAPLSPASLQRLKAQWQQEYETWKHRRLDDLEVVYVWADGLYVKAGLEDTKAALLVLIGALTDGRKVILAVESGQRESKESWGAVLRDLLALGLAPKAVERLHTDWERLVTFYQFPREHWQHLRTTNVVESPFAAVRLRTTAGKRDQAGRSGHRLDLEGSPGHRAHLPAADRAGAAAPGLRGCPVCRWRSESGHADGGCRLIPFTHLLTRPQ